MKHRKQTNLFVPTTLFNYKRCNNSSFHYAHNGGARHRHVHLVYVLYWLVTGKTLFEPSFLPSKVILRTRIAKRMAKTREKKSGTLPRAELFGTLERIRGVDTG